MAYYDKAEADRKLAAKEKYEMYQKEGDVRAKRTGVSAEVFLTKKAKEEQRKAEDLAKLEQVTDWNAKVTSDSTDATKELTKPTPGVPVSEMFDMTADVESGLPMPVMFGGPHEEFV